MHDGQAMIQYVVSRKSYYDESPCYKGKHFCFRSLNVTNLLKEKVQNP